MFSSCQSVLGVGIGQLSSSILELRDTSVFQPVAQSSQLRQAKGWVLGVSLLYGSVKCSISTTQQRICSLHLMSFELTAHLFGVWFFFSRFISGFNFLSSPLLILLFLSNYVYNFAFPKVTNILVQGSFSIKSRVFEPLSKTWFACLTSPLLQPVCRATDKHTVNHIFLTKKLAKSI